MQQFIALGRLTKDVEMSTTNNGTNVSKFAIAVSRNRMNNEGKYDTDFFNTITYGKTADNCKKYLKKGSQVVIVGSIENRSYKTKDGETRYITELIADRVNFLSNGSGANKETTPASQPAELEEIDEDNLPF